MPSLYKIYKTIINKVDSILTDGSLPIRILLYARFIWPFFVLCIATQHYYIEIGYCFIPPSMLQTNECCGESCYSVIKRCLCFKNRGRHTVDITYYPDNSCINLGDTALLTASTETHNLYDLSKGIEVDNTLTGGVNKSAPSKETDTGLIPKPVTPTPSEPDIEYTDNTLNNPVSDLPYNTVASTPLAQQNIFQDAHSMSQSSYLVNTSD